MGTTKDIRGAVEAELKFDPLVDDADMEQSELAEAPRSIVLDLLRRSHLHQNLAVVLGLVGRALDRVTRPFGLAEYPATSPVRRKTENLVFWVIVGGLLAWGAVATLTYLRQSIGFGAFGACIGLGAITLPGSSWSWSSPLWSGCR